MLRFDETFNRKQAYGVVLFEFIVFLFSRVLSFLRETKPVLTIYRDYDLPLNTLLNQKIPVELRIFSFLLSIDLFVL